MQTKLGTDALKRFRRRRTSAPRLKRALRDSSRNYGRLSKKRVRKRTALASMQDANVKEEEQSRWPIFW